MTSARLEAFSDGVFAIVITLLVIEIRPPHLDPGETLAEGLRQLWPNYVGYALSFLILGVMWLNHHRIFEAVCRVDGTVLVLNLNLLLWAALIPFPTAVVAESLDSGGADAKTAVAFYGGVILVTAVAYTALYMAATRPVIIGNTASGSQIRVARLRFGFGVAVYGGAFALSWLHPIAALVAHAVMAAYYLSEQASALPAPDPGQDGDRKMRVERRA